MRTGGQDPNPNPPCKAEASSKGMHKSKHLYSPFTNLSKVHSFLHSFALIDIRTVDDKLMISKDFTVAERVCD